MMRWIASRHAMVLGLGVFALGTAGGAKAQIPNEPAEINACLCLQQASAALLSEKDAKAQALATVNQQLADLDAQLASEKPQVNVNNPDSVSRYKALLERRDGAYRQVEPAQRDAAQSVARYNGSVDEYNRRCAGRPFNSALVAEIQAHLNCPPFR
jgi:hypothetical protein